MSALAAVVTVVTVGLGGCQSGHRRRSRVQPIALRDVRVEFEARSRFRQDNRDSKRARGDEDFRETIFQQRLRVEAEGSVYHPNLLDFSMALVGGLQQSEFHESLDGARRGSTADDTLDEFDVRATLFQNKDFPASVHAVRSRTFDPRPFRSSLETTTTSFDFTWQYVNPKTPTLFQFSDTNIDFDPFLRAGERPGTRTNRTVRFETAYHVSEHNIFSLNVSRESLKETPIELQYDTDEAYLEHRFEFGEDKQHRLLSTLRRFDQKGTFNIERTEWRETLRLKHTERLQSWYTLEFIDRTQGSFIGVEPVKERSYLVSGDLEHRLYESLTSRVSARFQQQKFGSGLEIQRLTTGVYLDYRKKNRWGKLYGDYSLVVERQERTGGDQISAITDEPRTFQDPDPIIITGSNISLATLTVRREDRTETYIGGRDYRIQNFGNRIELERIPTGRIRDGDTVLISYEFTLAGNFDLDTVQHRLGIRQEFDFGLSVYYRFYRQDQTITPLRASGVTVEDITAHTLGAEYRKGSFRLYAEYEDHNSTISPFESLRLGGDYTRRIGPATASFSAMWSDVQFQDITARSVTLWTLDGRYRHPITRKLKFEAGVAYRNERDNIGGDNEGIDFDVSAEWSFRTSNIRVTYEYSLYDDMFADDQSQALVVRFVRRF